MNDMNYFLDLEFHEYQKSVKIFGLFTIAKIWTIDLISIGIVCEDGREYYAINQDFNVKDAQKDKWLNDNVLSQLPPRNIYPRIWESPNLFYKSLAWKKLSWIRQEIADFMRLRYDPDMGHLYVPDTEDVKIYGYYSDYDWVRFCWIFGRMIDLPHGLPMYCVDLKQMLDERVERLPLTLNDIENTNHPLTRDATFDEKINWVKRIENGYPQQEDEHNALFDAKWNLELFKFIKSYL